MEYKTIDKLSIKETGTRSTGVTKFIRDTLDQIPEGRAVGMNELADTVLKECPSVKDKRQAYVRINHVLKSNEKMYMRMKDNEKGGTFIAKRSPEESSETASAA